jgi:transcriptional regulator with XRE-family HTH domain
MEGMRMAVMEVATTQFDVALGKRIKQIRRAKRLKQKVLEDALGYKSHTAIVYLESGQQPLSVEQAVRVAKALEVTLAELLGDLVVDILPVHAREPWLLTLKEQLTSTPKEYCAGVADVLESLATVYRARALSFVP